MKTLTVVALAILPMLAAAEKPDMTRQETWTEAEKEAFYEWLREQQSATGADEELAIGRQTIEEVQKTPGFLSNSYLSTRFGAYDLSKISFSTPKAADSTATGKKKAIGHLVGGDLQFGRPITTWFRQIYDLGLYRGSLDQKTDDGPDFAEHFWLYRAGYHLELALVPLGLDQTRNILLRVGADLMYGRGVESDVEGEERQLLQDSLLDQVEGLQGGVSWSLGYERQLGENFWRLHFMLDGFRSVHLPRDDDKDSLFGMGGFAGFSRVL